MMMRMVLAGMMAAAVTAGQAEQTTVSEAMKVAARLEFTGPECYYEFDGKTLSWTEPVDEQTHYIRLTIRDLVSSQPITGATAAAILTTAAGKQVGTSVTLHETWDPDMPHYGANVKVPDDVTSGNVAVKVEPPKGRRLGREEGNFLTKTVVLAFEGVNFGEVLPAKTADRETTGLGKVEWPEGRRPYVEPTPYPGAPR